MAIPRWEPEVELSEQERLLMKRLTRVKKLFGFMRQCRREVFDDGFQRELEGIYRDTGAGRTPVPPALMAMAVLLQAYSGASDAEAVELTVVDLRWQMVLGRLGESKPAFSQGALQDFRQRLIRSDMDKRLLARTREVAEASKLFDPKKLPKSIHAAMDSLPFEGAGRVEDTINLLAHAARKLVECAAQQTQRAFDEIVHAAGIPVLLAPSVKSGLDVNWSEPGATEEALEVLCRQIDSLKRWLVTNSDSVVDAPLMPYIAALVRVERQDVDRTGAAPRIREGVARDRLISVEDPDMKHGRKSESQLINGYKRHITVEMRTKLIVACAVTPANKAEHLAADMMNDDLETGGMRIASLTTDLGYLASPLVARVLERGGEVICRARPQVRRDGRFSKLDFNINLRSRSISCPAGETQEFQLGAVVRFAGCSTCRLRSACTAAKNGRTVSIAPDEPLQKRLRRMQNSRRGRARLRQRVCVEHRQAHLARNQGDRARYRGIRNNVFDTRRHAAVLNLEAIQLRQSLEGL